jgi:hypothetical protein
MEKAIDLKTALHVIQQCLSEDERRPMKLAIVVQSQGSIGGTPCVEVDSMQAGFDWDAGKLMIYPAQPLSQLSPEEVAAISESVSKGQSWHAYQAYKAQQEKLKSVQVQRDQAIADLREAANTLRHYETLHRAKGTAESTAKAEVNAKLAARFEVTIAKATA